MTRQTDGPALVELMFPSSALLALTTWSTLGNWGGLRSKRSSMLPGLAWKCHPSPATSPKCEILNLSLALSKSIFQTSLLKQLHKCSLRPGNFQMALWPTPPAVSGMSTPATFLGPGIPGAAQYVAAAETARKPSMRVQTSAQQQAVCSWLFRRAAAPGAELGPCDPKHLAHSTNESQGRHTSDLPSARRVCQPCDESFPPALRSFSRSCPGTTRVPDLQVHQNDLESYFKMPIWRPHQSVKSHRSRRGLMDLYF